MVDEDGRTDNGWMPDHGHPISSPCEPNSSGELTSICIKNLNHSSYSEATRLEKHELNT